MSILTPDSTLLGTIRGYPAAWRERVSQILQAIQTKFTDDETERVLSNKLIEGWNGTCDPTPVITVTSDGVNWALTLTGTGTVDLACFFGGVEHTFDTTPAVSINLTAGLDTAPQANFIYLTESGGTVSINNDTSGYPATAHIRIADCLLQSVASGQTLAAYLVHQHSEHISTTDSGAIVHHSEKIRELGATWFSGVAPANLVVSNPDAYISVGAGVVHQLHSHVFPAINMQTPATVYVVNDPTTAFKPITTLDDITQDAADTPGTINNRHFSLVLWGSQNANDTGQLYINLPTGTYATAVKAAQDANKYTVSSIPSAFKGTGFLIAEYRVQGKDSGTWVQNDLIDFRGQVPSISPGGGPGITDHGDLAGLTDDDHPPYHNDARALTWLADGGAEGGQPVSLWEQIKAGFNLSGGGTISMSAGSLFKWTARFIAISNGRGAHFSTAGFFDIIKPDGGILVGVGGASDRTWVVAGIVLNAWEALYYILPIGSDNTSLLANFRVADYRNALEVPADWILLAVRNGDDDIVRVGTGIHLGLGESRTNETVPKSLYDANSVLVAVSDNTPVVQAVADSEFVGRPAGGDVGVMTAAQARAVLSVGAVAIETHNITSPQGTVDFDISSETYPIYCIVGWVIPVNDGVLLFGRIKDAAGTIRFAATDYDWAGREFPIGGTTADQEDAADSAIRLTLGIGVGSAAGEGCSFTIWVDGTTAVNFNHAVSFLTRGRRDTGNSFHANGGGAYIAAAETHIDAFRLQFASGNIERMHATIYGMATV